MTVVIVEVVNVCTVVVDLVEVEVDVSSIVVEREVGSFVVAVVVLVVVVNGGGDDVEGFSQFWQWSVTSPSCTKSSSGLRLPNSSTTAILSSYCRLLPLKTLFIIGMVRLSSTFNVWDWFVTFVSM